MRALCLPRYGLQGASSRVRLYQYEPWFKSAGFEQLVSPLLADDVLRDKYKSGGYTLTAMLRAYWVRFKLLMSARQFNLVWIEKEALPFWPAWLERWLLRGVPYVLDFDDALFHNYDLHTSAWVRYFLGRRIDRLMNGAKLVVAGNSYLAARALAAGARRVEIVPSVVDLAQYPPKNENASNIPLRIVWIGSPSTTQYLLEIVEPLRQLAQRMPFTLRVIGASEISVSGIDLEPFAWTAGNEATLIAECDVGIMPLRDSPWEQGKCAYKLVQYMACSLPTLSSPIGANLDVVVTNETGLFANSPAEWVDLLELLLRDVATRKRLGEAGRKRVEAEYCVQRTAPRLVQLFKEAAGI